MTIPNIHPTTGIRYGVISGHSLDPELLDELYMKASAHCTAAALADRRNALTAQLQEALFGLDVPDCDYVHERIGELVEFTMEKEDNAGQFNVDEPSALIEHEGVKVEYGFMGGAPTVYVIESPRVTHVASLCSPCCPNAANLDSPEDPDGYECYTVPQDWLREEN